MSRASRIRRSAAAREQILRARCAAAERALGRGDYSRAERWLQRAPDPGDPAGRFHDAELLRWNLLGVVHKHQGRLAEAARAYREASRIACGSLPAGHEAFAALYHNLAGLDFSRGRYARAEALARWGISIRARRTGLRDGEYARDLAALGAIVAARRRPRAALRLLLRARRLFVSRLRPRGRMRELAITDHNIAATYQGLGRFREAERHYLRAISAKRRCLGGRHPSLRLSLHNLETLYRRWPSKEPRRRVTGTPP